MKKDKNLGFNLVFLGVPYRIYRIYIQVGISRFKGLLQVRRSVTFPGSRKNFHAMD